MLAILILFVITTHAFKMQLNKAPYHSLNSTRHNHPIVGSHTNSKPLIFLHDFREVMYWGNVTVGPQKQIVTFMFDTGQSPCWVPSDSCSATDCPNFRFSSDSIQVLSKDPTSTYTETYATASVTGQWTSSSFCVNDETCTENDFKFVIADTVTSLSGLKSDGICGLMPSNPTFKYKELVPALDKARVIDKN